MLRVCYCSWCSDNLHEASQELPSKVLQDTAFFESLEPFVCVWSKTGCFESNKLAVCILQDSERPGSDARSKFLQDTAFLDSLVPSVCV